MSNRFAPRTDWARHPRDRKPESRDLEMAHRQQMAYLDSLIARQHVPDGLYEPAIFKFTGWGGLR